MILIERRSRWARTLVTAGLAVALGVGVVAPADAAVTSGHRGRLVVVAGVYPLAWLARQVGGSEVRVTDLTPPGVEPHDLELSTADRDRIDGADLVLTVGGSFQPAVERAAQARSRGTVDLFRTLGLAGPGSGPGDDPHLWLHLPEWRRAVEAVRVALRQARPEAAATFTTGADRVEADLAALDDRYRAGLAECRRHLVATVHDAFGGLARYGVDPEALTGRAPEAEPDARRLGDLADRMRRDGATTVFTEPREPPSIARTLAREGGAARVAVLDPVERLSAVQQRRGDDYLTVMGRNLRALRTALGCA
ncbi:MAG: metal ABC transporter substrate-binding protein [Actinomycetes bacterium]